MACWYCPARLENLIRTECFYGCFDCRRLSPKEGGEDKQEKD